jgi:hypothetical protein
MPTYQERVRQAIDAHAPEHLREYLYRMAGKEGPVAGKRSPTGAAGPLQFTEGTGKRYGLVGPQGDIREDVDANIKSGVTLTLDNAATMKKILGRDPSYGELALAHQQGASTAARMVLGTGNASTRNLEVNNVNPNLPPQAAAEKIMNYYGFGNKTPGTTLNTQGMFDPNAPGAFAATAPGAVPFAGGFTPPPGGTTLTSAPADIAAASGAAPASFAQRLFGGANNTGDAAKNTPFANTFAGLEDIKKGINPKTATSNDPRDGLNYIAPSNLAASVGQQQAASQPLAQGLLTQMIQAMQQRRR